MTENVSFNQSRADRASTVEGVSALARRWDGFDGMDAITAAWSDWTGRASGASTGASRDFPAVIDLGNLDPKFGFAIQGDKAFDYAGRSVAGGGDINGDGFDEIIIGAPFGDDGGADAGEAYVIFCRGAGFQNIDLTNLAVGDGFVLRGGASYQAGTSVSSAGDVNGDGFDDLIVGAPGAEGGGEVVGSAFIIFGKANGFTDIELSNLAASDGFTLQGDREYDLAGRSVSSAGDIDGDGFDDLIVGAYHGDDGGSNAGEAYVVFGRAPGDSVTRIGSAADQAIRGGKYDDALAGRGGDDVLSGAGGDDVLSGGAGRDTLRGGRGADRVKASATLDRDDADIISGFETGSDEIALRATVFGLPEGALDTDRLVVSHAAHDADDRLIYQSDSGKLYFDPDGTGDQPQILIAKLTGAPLLEAGDFIVI